MEAISFEDLKREIFDREVLDEYRKIIDEFNKHGGFEGCDYATPLIAGLPVPVKDIRLKEFLGQKISGKTLIDLGCGRKSRPVGVAQEYHANRYIGVDLRTLLSNGYDPSPVRGGVGVYYFSNEDMLEFVSKLRDGISEAYLLSAIETRKNTNDKHTQAYLNALAKEVSRTLGTGGIIIFVGGDCKFLEHLLMKQYGFRRVNFSENVDEKSPQPSIYARVYMKG